MGNSSVLEKPPALDKQTIAVLWMDDNPNVIEPLIAVLIKDSKMSDGLDFKVDIATSITEAEQLLKRHQYAALIVDCQMDTADRTGENGAEFLCRINQSYKCLPTFVYTAFRDEAIYENYLNKSNAIDIAEKVGEDFDPPLKSYPFFRELYKYAQRYHEVINLIPEEISFQDYISNPAKYHKEVASHWQRNNVWITNELKDKGWIWGVVCGNQIVKGSSDLFEFPTEEELYDLGCHYNRIPFAYNLAEEPEIIDPPLSTGTRWNPINNPTDYYPTLKVCIGEQELIDDFDTGAFQTQVSDEIVRRSPLDALQYKETEHLGEKVNFFTKTIPIVLFCDNGNELSSRIPVRVIINWNQSTFVKINPNRQVLLGRDLLRAFSSIKVILLPKDHLTSVIEHQTNN